MGLLTLLALCTSCKDEWDNHYGKKEAVIHGAEMEIVNEPIEEYLGTTADLKGMNDLFAQTGVFNKMDSLDVNYTMFVVDNATLEKSLSENIDPNQPEDEQKAYLAKGHVVTASLAPDFIKDGQRLLMWNQKYVDITVTDPTLPATKAFGNDGEIIFNTDCRIKKVVKASNGYVYVLDNTIITPKSLLEVLEELPEKYSIFKNAVLSKNMKVFDKKNSTAIGVDKSGNTVYDSVFSIKNPYFEKYKFDLSSESMKATMFIPSNELIEKALSEGKKKLADWGLERQDSILENWCFQAMFFKTEYKPEDFQAPEKPENMVDLYSVFDKQWRTTVQGIDLAHPIRMSNGTAYYVTDLKIPTKDILIWRFKDKFSTWNRLTDADRARFHFFTNCSVQATGNGVRQEVKPWTPGGGWPTVENSYLWINMDKNVKTATFEFILYKLVGFNEENNTYERAEEYLVPPGEYTLHLGCGKRNNIVSEADLYVNDEWVRSFRKSDWSNLNYDRGGGGGPEFYNLGTNRNYDMDGTKIATVTIKGDKAVPVHLKFVFKNNPTKQFNPANWCLRPTIDNY